MTKLQIIEPISTTVFNKCCVRTWMESSMLGYMTAISTTSSTPINIPFVYAYSHGSKQDHYVSYNNIDGAMDAVNYLINHGHREIAVLAGHPDSFPTHQRMEGFITSLCNADLPVRDEFLFYGDWEYPSGYEQMKNILALTNRPTAIFVMNDLMAAGCINSAQEAGLKIPRDLSIIGFDNREIASYLPVPLTTIQVPES